MFLFRLLNAVLLICLLSLQNTAFGQSCFFTHKFSSTTSGYAHNIGHTVETDAAGNTYLLGTYYDTVDVDPGPSIHLLTSVVGSNINGSYLVKLDPSGAFVWAVNYPAVQPAGFNLSSGYHKYGIPSIAVDNQGNVYFAGDIGGYSHDFNPGAGTAFVSNSAFITKVDSNGNFLWIKSFAFDQAGINYLYFTTITVDANNNPIAAGAFSGTPDFDPGQANFLMTAPNFSNNNFVMKLSDLGNFVWAKSFGYTILKSISADNGNNIYLHGFFTQTIDADPGAGTFSLNPCANGVAAFLGKLNAAGAFQWAQAFCVLSGEGLMDTDPSGNIFISGIYDSNTDLDAGPGVTNLPVASYPFPQFVAKINSAGVFQWVVPYAHNSSSSTSITALRADGAGNIYIGVRFDNNGLNLPGPDFDPGPGVFHINQFRLAVYKLNASGGFVVAKPVIGSSSGNLGIGSILLSQINAIAVTNNSIITTGWLRESTNVDFNPDPNQALLLSGDYFGDTFISKIPALTPTVQSISDATCFGAANGAATVAVLAAVPPLTYSWNTQPGNTNNSSNTLAAGTHIVTVTDATGCSQTAPAIVINQPAAIVTTSTVTNESCVGGGSNGQVAAAVSGGMPPYTYSWNTSPVQTTATATNLAMGTYQLTVTDSTGCQHTSQVYVGKDPNPAAFSYSINGMVATLSVMGSACNSFVWDFGNGNTSTINPNPIVTYSTPGTYGVCLQCNGLPASCTPCINITVPGNASGVVSTEEEVQKKEVALYPNPATDIVSVEAVGTIENTNYTVFNILGEEVIRGVLKGDVTPVKVQKLPAGIYLLQIQGVKQETLKLVKQ